MRPQEDEENLDESTIERVAQGLIGGVLMAGGAALAFTPLAPLAPGAIGCGAVLATKAIAGRDAAESVASVAIPVVQASQVIIEDRQEREQRERQQEERERVYNRTQSFIAKATAKAEESQTTSAQRVQEQPQQKTTSTQQARKEPQQQPTGAWQRNAKPQQQSSVRSQPNANAVDKDESSCSAGANKSRIFAVKPEPKDTLKERAIELKTRYPSNDWLNDCLGRFIQQREKACNDDGGEIGALLVKHDLHKISEREQAELVNQLNGIHLMAVAKQGGRDEVSRLISLTTNTTSFDLGENSYSFTKQEGDNVSYRQELKKTDGHHDDGDEPVVNRRKPVRPKNTELGQFLDEIQQKIDDYNDSNEQDKDDLDKDLQQVEELNNLLKNAIK